tara:strand:+ start:8176 stop:9135 length:960 start_codon:yes stop_codon:yes gene_type:complete
MQILNLEPEGYCDSARLIIEKIGKVDYTPLNRNQLIKVIPNYDGLIVRLKHQINKDILEHAPRLKFIVSATTGLDHIDLKYTKSKNISVLSLQGETEFLDSVHATSEHTWAILMTLMRNIPQAISSVNNNIWDRDRFKGVELYGKTLGIIGYGRIGSKIAKYGKSFGMKINIYDPYSNRDMTKFNKTSSLSDLLKTSDIISIHVPLNENTKNFIGTNELNLLSPTSIIVNTSRGELIDETALVKALKNKQIAGAALDVIHNERDQNSINSNLLIKYSRHNSNLIITPHISGATYESMKKTEVFMANKLLDYANTKWRPA